MFRLPGHSLASLPPANFALFRRWVSSGYFRPRPRPYRRRLYETALAPIVPKKLEREWKKANDPFNMYSASPEPKAADGGDQLTEYELALVEKLGNWIRSEQFRVMTICQLNSTKDETLWLARNQFRLNGLELCDAPCKILRKLFAPTRFRPINSLLLDEFTCLLFGKDPECIDNVFSLCNRFTWLQPLALTVDSRILNLDHALEFADADPHGKLRSQTAQMFGQLSGQIPNSLDTLIGEIPRILDAHLKAASG